MSPEGLADRAPITGPTRTLLAPACYGDLGPISLQGWNLQHPSDLTPAPRYSFACTSATRFSCFSLRSVAGAINSVAGGGSFITFPALLFAGVAPIAANATNTAAVWPGTVASTVAYRKAFTPEARRLLPPLIITGIVGGF